MTVRRRSIVALLICWLAPAGVFAQGTRADYARSDGLFLGSFGTLYNGRVFPHWTADGNAFWYVDYGPGQSRHFWWVDAIAGTRKPAFDHARLPAALKSAGLYTDLNPDHIPVTDIAREPDGTLALVLSPGVRVTIDPATCAVTGTKWAVVPPPHPLARLDTQVNSDLVSSGENHAVIDQIVNRTGGPINLDMVEPDGQHVSFFHGTGNNGETDVFTGEVFGATDNAGQSLGFYRVDGDGGQLVIDPPPKPSTRPAAEPEPRDRNESPDGQWVIHAEDHDLWLRDVKHGGETRLSRDGADGDGYEYWFRLWWSPDSKYALVSRDLADDHHQSHWVHSTPPDELRPQLESSEYITPMDRITCSSPHLFSIAGRREVPIAQTNVDRDIEIFDSAAWEKDSSEFVFRDHYRGDQIARIVRVDPGTGRARVVDREQSKTFVDCRSAWMYLFGVNSDLICLSERGGWNHLWRFDLINGRAINEITRGPWIVQPWDEKLDEVGNDMSIYFRAGGIDPKQDPYYVHYCRVNPDGSKLVDFTPGDGTHQVQDSPDGRFYIDTYSRIDMPPVVELRRYDDGSLVCPLEKADDRALLATGWRYPERFIAKGRDGTTDIYGVIYRPKNFDPAKKYPVVEDIYPGPQQYSVPKAFTRWNPQMGLAELGFIVVQIDGMGTPGRSKAFHDVCWHDVADCGFADRIAWMKAAAVKHPEMDLTRVGIIGGSAGGYAALRALETHGDFYKVAVAQDGCHDLRLQAYEWTEQWMGWPVGPWYARQCNAPLAKDVTGSLMLIVSELDHTVDPSATMQVVDALVKADKDFDLLMVPNAGHCGGGEYVDRRRKDFLVRHLIGTEPRAR